MRKKINFFFKERGEAKNTGNGTGLRDAFLTPLFFRSIVMPTFRERSTLRMIQSESNTMMMSANTAKQVRTDFMYNRTAVREE